MPDSLIGHTIDQYRVVAELGRGRHSVVYKAWHQSLERYVALKVLRRHDGQTFARFQTEARLTAYLSQEGIPNVRQLYRVGRTPEGDLFVALEYVDDSLWNVLQRAKEGKHRIDPSAAAKLLKPVAEALDAIHSLGWVHLDIKPQNILVGRRGRTMLADFGIAQRQGTCTPACTPTYASPEQAAGDRPVGSWSDVYSLGVVLYEMIAGYPPVRGDHDIVLLNQHLGSTPPSPRHVNPQLRPEQEQALFKALAKPPEKRFQTAGELVQAMLQHEPAASDALDGPRVGSAGAWNWRRLVPRLVLAAAILALVLALAALAGWVLLPQSPFGQPVETGVAPGSEAPAALGTDGTAVPRGSSASATAQQSGVATERARATLTATASKEPTATLASTSTWTPRPTPRPTVEATATDATAPAAEPSAMPSPAP